MVLGKYMPRCRIFLLDGAKFRTNLLVLFFDLPLKRETATKTALLAKVLKNTDRQEAVKQAEEMYGALWDVSVVKKGDRQLLLFSVEVLKTVDTEDAAAFLRQRVLRPLEMGFLKEKTVDRQKEILRQEMKGLQDDKRAFAQKRISEETAEGTDHAVSADGYAEDLDEITANGLFGWYRKIVEEAEVKVFFCGDKEEKRRILSLRQDFSGRVPFSEKEEAEHPKNGPRFIREKAETAQARLCLGFLADTGNACRQASLHLLHQLLGGSPDSMLFQKIREEQGLCYDVKSVLEPMSPYLFVQTGIRAEDAKEVGKQVLQCLEQMKSEGVSKEKLRQAKDTLLRQVDALADSPWAMVDFLAEQVLQGKELTTEKFRRQIERIEGEDILCAAKHLELQVVYLLGGKEEADEN